MFGHGQLPPGRLRRQCALAIAEAATVAGDAEEEAGARIAHAALKLRVLAVMQVSPGPTTPAPAKAGKHVAEVTTAPAHRLDIGLQRRQRSRPASRRVTMMLYTCCNLCPSATSPPWRSAALLAQEPINVG